MTLYIKYRPKNFNDFVGNEEVVSSIESIISNPASTPHAFLFEGDYGSGKTTLAYILANKLNCEPHNLFYIDAGTLRKVESADNIKKVLTYLPISGDKKIFIIDEIQTTTGSKFQESLLHTLEDPPEYVYFILCTTNMTKINKGILSRCVIFSLRNYTVRELIRIQKNILEKERKEIPDDIIRYIASKSLNSPRQVLTNLEKVINDNNINLDKTKEIIGTIWDNTKDNTVPRLVKALTNNSNLNSIIKILLESKLTPEEIKNGIINYCYNTIIRSNESNYKIISLFMTFNSLTQKKTGTLMDKHLLLTLILLYKESVNG